MPETNSNNLIDTVINLVNKLSYTGGGITLGSLAAYKEQLSIVFAALALLFTALTFFVSLYFQLKRNRREEQEELRKEVIFEQEQEERRLHKIPDNGNRDRITDK